MGKFSISFLDEGTQTLAEIVLPEATMEAVPFAPQSLVHSNLRIIYAGLDATCNWTRKGCDVLRYRHCRAQELVIWNHS
jgi:hypothetical protein